MNKSRSIVIKSCIFVKNALLWMRIHLFLGWSKTFLKSLSNIINLSQFVAEQNKTKTVLNDFCTFKREYKKREKLYEHVIAEQNIAEQAIDYIEFGVASGNSFRWFANRLKNAQTRFYGFDTFEGLPENWGVFKAGDMSSNIPQINDERVSFFKGYFQNTLPSFIEEKKREEKRRMLIHCDADLFSSTLYVLTSMAPLLKKGDIIFFDEFNVPNHEFLAFKMFTESYYIKTQLLGAVNNYYQAAFIIC